MISSGEARPEKRKHFTPCGRENKSKHGGTMRSTRLSRFVIFFVAMVVASGPLLAYDRTETFEFEDVQSIHVKTVCGGLEIVPGEESKFVVVVENRLDDPRLFKRRVETSRGRLLIDEDFLGRSVHGGTQWTIYVPKSAKLQSVEFSTASGAFSLEQVDAGLVETDIASGSVHINSVHAQEFDLSTASGSIEIEDCQVDQIDAESASGSVEARNVKARKLELSTASGEVDIRLCDAVRIKASSASGDVRVESVNGNQMDLSSASGSVVMRDCRVDESAEMSCASGDVQARLSRLPSDLLHASTASGDVLLEVDDFGESFTMTLTKRAEK
jgi:DUF4097 and DUF4098 domain-containing protein YvlB